jgi:hypothetical protein
MAVPIALFVFRRLEHTRRTVEALSRNVLAAESDLIVFSDGSKKPEHEQKVAEVRAFVKTIKGFRTLTIVEREVNQGLARSIIQGVTQVVEQYGSVIVVEDDLVTSPFFLSYMNRALALYADDDRVISIHGYTYPVKGSLPESFFIRGADCWGWATWQRGWELFEHDGNKLLAELERRNLTHEFDYQDNYPYTAMLKAQVAGHNDSWAIRWYASAFLKDRLTLYPGTSLVMNIGNDNTGTHGGKSTDFDTVLNRIDIDLERREVREDPQARRMFVKYFRSVKPSFARRMAGKVKRFLLGNRKDAA